MMQGKGKAICFAVMLTLMLPAIAASQYAAPVWGEWTVDQMVSGPIEIPSGKTLTIDPGVTVSFAAGAKLIVRDGGTLTVNPPAAGCDALVSRVVFDEAVEGAGWDGIIVQDGGSATLNYVDINNATETGLKIMSGAAVASLLHVSFTGNSGNAGGALYVEQDLSIAKSVFSNNQAGLYGGAIEVVGGGTLTLADVDFENNSAVYAGGAVDLLSSSLVMVRGEMRGNTAPAGSAIMAYGAGGGITNAFFTGQSVGAVVQRGGNGALSIAYSTFSGNAGVACLAGDTDDNVTLFADILWGNGSALDLPLDGGAAAAITYSDIEAIGSYPSGWFGAGNFDTDPIFVTAGEYPLDSSSPCIAAAVGKDMGVTGGAAAPAAGPVLIDMTGAAVANPFDVGTASVGGSITRTIRLANQGGADATIASVAVTGAQAGAFTLGAIDLPVVLGPGECLDLDITFTPTAPGSYTLANLVITHSGGVIINGLTGDTQEGSGNDLVVAPTTVDFGGVLSGTSSVPMSFNITNPAGNGGIVDIQLAVSGSDAGFFSLSETEFTVPKAGTRTVWATFSPNAVRDFEAIVTPTVNGVERPDRAVLLTGTGTNAIFTVAPAEHQFPPTTIGTAGNVNVTVTNVLAAQSILVNAEISGSGADNFSLDMASAPIDMGGSQAFNVTFTPMVAGFVQATLTFTSELGGNTYSETVDLRGVGIATTSGIGVAPLALSFPDTSVGGSAGLSFTVTNALNAFVNVTVSAPTAPEFAIASASSFILFPAGDAGGRDSRTVDVVFTPSDATTLFAGSVDVVGTLGIFTVGTETVTMQGRGMDAAIDIAPAEIDFGDVDLATTSATVSVSVLNSGTEPANIYAGLLDGANAAEFSIDNDTCSGTTLAAGHGCYYEVSVTPATEGAKEAALSIYTSESPDATVVNLLANGVVGAAASISVAPTTIDMGDVSVFTPANPIAGLKYVVVTNTGTSANLDVSSITFSGYDAAQFTAAPAGPFTVPPGASAVVAVSLVPTGIGPRATTMTVASNAGDVDVSITADSQVGYPYVDGNGYLADGSNTGSHPNRADTLYVVPGGPESYMRALVTVLDALMLPADRFVWIEGVGGGRWFYDEATTTWNPAPDMSDIRSADAGAILQGYSLPITVVPPIPAEGEYTLHTGFDLIRNNAVTDLPYFYVDYGRRIVYGPHPTVTMSPSTVAVGANHPTGTFGAVTGTSTTNVEIYIWAQPASGGILYLDGAGTWSATQAPVYTGDVSLWGGQTITNPWTGYAITDSGQVGVNTFHVTFDRTADGALNDRIFEATTTVTVTP